MSATDVSKHTITQRDQELKKWQDLQNLVCPILRALIGCIKCIKDQQVIFNFIGVLVFYFGHQHVSATHVAIYMVINLRTKLHI